MKMPFFLWIYTKVFVFSAHPINLGIKHTAL